MDKQLDQFLNSDFYNYDWTIDKLDATFECCKCGCYLRGRTGLVT